MTRAPEYPPVTDPVHPHPEEPKRLETNEARQSVTLGHMRYVLAFGLGLVIVAFVLAYYSVI